MNATSHTMKVLSLIALLSCSALGQDARVEARQLSIRCELAIEQAYAQSVRVETLDGHGSGTIVSADGLILTAHHVVDTEAPIVCILRDGRRLSARVVLIDSEVDIALLQVEASGLDSATCSSHSAGSWVLASGYPYAGFGDGLPTVSLGRLLGTNGRIMADGGRMFDKLQVMDAPIFCGSSGSGLFDEMGHLVGVVVARSDLGDRGFAVSIADLSLRRAFALRLCLDATPKERHLIATQIRPRDVWFRQFESSLSPALRRGRVSLWRPDDGTRFVGLRVSRGGDVLLPLVSVDGLRIGASLGRGFVLKQVDPRSGLALASIDAYGDDSLVGVSSVSIMELENPSPNPGALVFASNGRLLTGGMLNALSRSPIMATPTGLLGCDLDLPTHAMGQMVVDTDGRFVGMVLGTRLSSPLNSAEDKPVGAFIVSSTRMAHVYRHLKPRETVTIPGR